MTTKKACPFCGARGKDLTFDSGYSRFVVVECENCGAKGPTLAVTHDGPTETDTQALATIAWNQRRGF